MKKVIFVCLLSLSFCLSKPAEDQGKPTQPEKKDVTTPKMLITTEQSQVPSKLPVTVTSSEQNPASKKPENETLPHMAENATIPNETKDSVNKSTTVNDTTNKKKDMPEKTVQPTEGSKPTATTETKPAMKNDTKPEEKTEKMPTSTTEKETVTPKPTEGPKKDEDKPTLQARGFDGPSFIGGIILTLGLLAIGFMGFKYYKNQTERNYHTL